MGEDTTKEELWVSLQRAAFQLGYTISDVTLGIFGTRGVDLKVTGQKKALYGDLFVSVRFELFEKVIVKGAD
jgi:hypothetical protein